MSATPPTATGAAAADAGDARPAETAPGAPHATAAAGGAAADAAGDGGAAGTPLRLTLYVAGQTPKSVAAIRNFEALCHDHMPESVEIEVIDLRLQPHLAREHNIVAIPTLVRSLPVPVQKIIGDLSDRDKVLVHLRIDG